MLNFTLNFYRKNGRWCTSCSLLVFFSYLFCDSTKAAVLFVRLWFIWVLQTISERITVQYDIVRHLGPQACRLLCYMLTDIYIFSFHLTEQKQSHHLPWIIFCSEPVSFWNIQKRLWSSRLFFYLLFCLRALFNIRNCSNLLKNLNGSDTYSLFCHLITFQVY